MNLIILIIIILIIVCRHRLKSIIWRAGLQNPSSAMQNSKSASKRVVSAAMARSESKHASTSKKVNCEEEIWSSSAELRVNDSKKFTDGVRFRCRSLDPKLVLSKSEWYVKIEDYLNEQLQNERGLAAALIIRNCNSDSGNVDACVEILRKYLQNIMNQPEEEKFKKIRIGNRTFQEKVVGIKGAIQFLESLGFVREELVVEDHSEEFLVFRSEKVENVQYWNTLIEALSHDKYIELELDRDAQILQPAQAEEEIELPNDFFEHTFADMKTVYFSRQKQVDDLCMFQTKALREKQKLKELRKRQKYYRYALLRIRFPDGVYLQGTFSVNEKFEEVVKFVKNNLVSPCNFSLVTHDIGRGFKPEDHKKTLKELCLVPATVLIFRSKLSSNAQDSSFLKPNAINLQQN